ncbi:sensor histidine kinase, partial [Falsiroseomonas oryziterrae]|uniref:sensor histidine kinase n=1 Tax=Falsiroseomonas oryziterrae TaxID=2911368 RepID=UPI001F3C26C2
MTSVRAGPLAWKLPRPGVRPTLRLLRAGSLLLPLVVLAIWAGLSWRAEQARGAAQALANAELAREYALRVLQSQEAMLTHVADLLAMGGTSGASQRALHERLATLERLPGVPVTAGVVSAAGRLVLSSRTYPVDVDVSDRAYYRALRDAPAAALHIERQVLRPRGPDTLLLARRRPGAGFDGVLLATVPVTVFTGFFGRLADDPRASASLLAADGMLLVRHRPEEPAVRLGPDMPAMRAIATADSGTYVARAVSDGITRIYGFTRLGSLPLYAHYGVPVAELQESWVHALAPIAALILLSGLLGFVALEHAARALAAEERRRAAEEAERSAADRLRAAEREAELHGRLLMEVHHRVRNSLAIVQSFARMRRGGDDDGGALERRVLALAKVHELLHVAGLASRLDLAAFLRALCASPAFVTPGRVELSLRTEPVEIEVERATSVALAVGELLANAVRHAFPDGRMGRVEVTLEVVRGGREARLLIRDDGVGRAEGAAEGGPRSGLGLAGSLARRAGGTLALR